MNESQSKNCVSCSQSTPFDAEQAYKNLSKKYTDLGDIVTAYMSQAGMERAARTSNALDMAETLKRMVGGTIVKPGTYSECCLIGQKFPNQQSQWFCTGVLIHPRIVLSAAHCHQPPGLIANVVALNCDNKDQLGKAEIISARRTVVHPNYASSDGLHDISVLILRKAATKSAPVPYASTAEISVATRTTLVGFGNDDANSSRGFGVKREVEVDITSIRRSPNDDLDDAEEEFGFESDLEFVAGGGGFDSCNGDSGGPAYISVGGTRKVAGLTSRAKRNATKPCGEGGVYTRVDQNLDFIKEVAKQSRIDFS
jgi:secreted trypsin-like serine protease